MVHLVYCDNAGKKGEHVLDKILTGTKTMVVRGAAAVSYTHLDVYKRQVQTVSFFAFHIFFSDVQK